MKYTDLAKKYGTTTDVIKASIYNFLQNEGYLGDGTECQNIFEWLDATINRCPVTGTEPFQKSDLDYELL
jgi:hypothetical protein